MKKIILIFIFFGMFFISSCKDNSFENPYFRVSAGEYHMVAVSPKNQVYTWGQNLYGQLGTGEFSSDKHSSLPIDITKSFKFKYNEGIIDVIAGAHHNLLITTHGRIFLWGTEDIYDNDSERVATPINITSRFDLEKNEVIKKVSGDATVAMTSLNKVY